MGQIGKTLLIIIVAIVGFFTLPWLLLFVGLMLMPTPPQPVIRHGEFPVKIVFEYHGKRHIVEDTVICDYAGISVDEGRGKRRKWTARYGSGHEKLVLMTISATKTIYVAADCPEYFMNDLSTGIRVDKPGGFVVYDPAADSPFNPISVKELLDKYQVKIVSYYCAKPVNNTFR